MKACMILAHNKAKIAYFAEKENVFWKTHLSDFYEHFISYHAAKYEKKKQ